MIRDYLAKGLFKLECVSTVIIIADIVTNGLEIIKHREYTKMNLQDKEQTTISSILTPLFCDAT